MNSDKFIGIFDSGLGGLTVVKEVWSQLPSQNTIYLGDTARVPYGTKSLDTIQKYSIQNSTFLLEHSLEAIVVACNTASAYSIEKLKSLFEVPIIGVIEPGARDAISSSKTQHIGVFGTKGTIQSQAYSQKILSLSSQAQVFSQACPLLVPFVEEGWLDHDVTRKIISIYWDELKSQSLDIDTLILGCTHYPLLKDLIQEVVGDEIVLIDSAVATAHSLKELLEKKQSVGEKFSPRKEKFFVTDDPDGFKYSAEMFLEHPIDKVEKVFVE